MVPLTSSEQKKLIRMQRVERTLTWSYIGLGIAFLMTISTVVIGVILQIPELRMLGTLLSFLTLSLILGIREQMKLFRIIKKLQQTSKTKEGDRHLF